MLGCNRTSECVCACLSGQADAYLDNIKRIDDEGGYDRCTAGREGPILECQFILSGRAAHAHY